MTSDEERWAEALAIEHWKGDDAEAFVTERIAKLTAAGNDDGVARFREIETRLRQLRAGARQ